MSKRLCPPFFPVHSVLHNVDLVAGRNVLLKCVFPENIHTPHTEGTGKSWGSEWSQRPNFLRKCMKLSLNFLRVGGWGGGP